jgi:hypothetical protein
MTRENRWCIRPAVAAVGRAKADTVVIDSRLNRLVTIDEQGLHQGSTPAPGGISCIKSPRRSRAMLECRNASLAAHRRRDGGCILSRGRRRAGRGVRGSGRNGSRGRGLGSRLHRGRPRTRRRADCQTRWRPQEARREVAPPCKGRRWVRTALPFLQLALRSAMQAW